MSGDEPGYVPPDHRTTAEFGVPGKAAAPEAAAPVTRADSTLTDAPGDANTTVQDERDVLFGTPAPEPADDPAEPTRDEAAPATVTDVPAEPITQNDMPVPAHTESPAPRLAAAPQGPPPAGASGAGRRVLLAGAIVLAALLAAGAAAVLLLTRGGPDEKGGSAAPSAPAAGAPATGGGGAEPTGEPTPGGTPATPSPSGGPAAPPPSPAPAAPVGPLVAGEGITYRLVQRDPGYFEGRVVITNRTDRPMKTWKITFRAPRADVKNIWGARLVRGGEKAEIQNLAGAPAIPPGGTWEVRFGAAGPASTPRDCTLNGEDCGF